MKHTENPRRPLQGLVGRALSLAALGLLIFGIAASPLQAALATAHKVIGYVPSYRGNVSFVRYDKLTHINYAFLVVREDGTYTGEFDANLLPQVVTNAHAQGVKVLISVGGGSNANAMGRAITNAAYATSAATLKSNLLAFMATYQLDGIDLDWEYPQSATDATAFTSFVTSLATDVHAQGKLLSAATVGANWVGQYYSDAAVAAFDYLNVMAYDVAGVNHSSYQIAVDQLGYWAGRGVPASKLVLGVPFYGYPSPTFSWSAMAYKDILASDPTAYSKDLAAGYAYNGEPTMIQKTQLAMTSAHGIMIWELSMDSAAGNHSLLDAIASTISSPVTSYTITASAGSNGSVSPSGAVSVVQGASQAFTITPAAGYTVDAVLVDGVSKGALTSYTFSNVTTAHTLSASFKLIPVVTYTLTASAGAGGSISPSGTTTLAQGATQTFTITPSSGYTTAGVLVDGASQGAISSYTFSNVTANHTISASFTAVTPSSNLALGKAATASSVETVDFPASYAVDGNASTRWASAYVDPTWIAVDLGAATTFNKVVLSWEAAYGKTYQIQTSSDNSTWTTVYTQSAGVGGVETLTFAGTTARYVRMNGTSRATQWGYSLYAFEVYNTATAVCAAAPAVPTGLASPSQTSTSANLSWSPVTAPANCTATYRVYSRGIQILTGLTSTSTTITGLTAGTTYSFTVAAADAAGLSAQSTALSVTTLAGTCGAAPAVPTGLASPSQTSTSANLSWSSVTAPANCSVTYRVYSRGIQILTGLTSTSATVTGLTAGTTYSFTVAAADTAGLSAQSTALSVTTPAATCSAAPAVPTGLASPSQTSTSANLTWTAVTAPANCSVTYRVYSRGIQILTGLTSTSTPVTGLTAGTIYSFTVAAADAAGLSAQSAALAVTTAASTFGITASAGANGSISPSGSVTVNSGASQSFSITPATGYVVDTVTVDGASAGSVTSYTFSNVLAAHTINATFKAAGGTKATGIPGNPHLSSNATGGASFTLHVTMWYGNNGSSWVIYENGNPFATVAVVDNSPNQQDADYVVSGKANGTYSYTCKLVNSFGSSILSDPLSVTVTQGTTGDTVAPSTPTGLQATATASTSISLAWTAATDNVGVTAYDVTYGASTVTVTTPSATISGLTANTSYTFSVKARDAAGNASAASAGLTVVTSPAVVDTQAPSTPQGLTSTGKSSSSVALAWTAATDNVGVTGYVVAFGSNTRNSASTSLTVTGLAASTAYSFTVKAQDAAGNLSGASSALTVTTDAQGAIIEPAQMLFDDFSYSSPDDPAFLANWKASDYSPAAPGLGIFAKSNVTFAADSGNTSNTLMQIHFTTAGSRETTVEGEVEGQRRFLYGTYATRMKYYNQPVQGPAQVVGPDTGDHMVATFFTISPYYVPNTQYGELDFEYLPNAGWNGDGPRFTTPTMWNTTWETRDVRITKANAMDCSGWHTFWMTVFPTAVSYYMDDTLLVTHTDTAYIPKTEMLIMYNLWLTGEQFATGQNGTSRTWEEDVDWLYHAKDTTMTRADVENAVAYYRSHNIKKVDTMPAPILPPAN